MSDDINYIISDIILSKSVLNTLEGLWISLIGSSELPEVMVKMRAYVQLYLRLRKGSVSNMSKLKATYGPILVPGSV